MNHFELAILNFLRATPTLYLSRREIARKALGRDAFEENQRWIDAPLTSLSAKGLVEQDDSGHYRLRTAER